MYLVSLARKVIKTSGFIYQVYILAIAIIMCVTVTVVYVIIIHCRAINTNHCVPRIYVGLLYAVDSVESSCIRAVMHSVT